MAACLSLTTVLGFPVLNYGAAAQEFTRHSSYGHFKIASDMRGVSEAEYLENVPTDGI